MDTATRHSGSWTNHLPVVGGIALAGAYIASRAVVEMDAVPRGVRAAVAILPAVVFVVWVIACVGAARRMVDELERRIQLEALAFAFPCAFALLMALGLLELVVELPPDDLSYRHVWAALPICYLAGLTIARRRYA
jgi:hypothetical protein